MKHRARLPSRLLLSAMAAALLGACQSIPDMSGWSQSTTDVTSAITEAFQASARINGDLAQRIDPHISGNAAFQNPSTRYEQVARELRRRADDYEVLFGAIADYSASLSAIAKAAYDSEQAVEGIAGSLNSLVGSFGATALSGPAFNLMKRVGEEVIKIKAASDFSDAVEKADPYIDQFAVLLDSDLADLENTVADSKDEAIRAALEEPYRRDFDYYRALSRRRAELQASIGRAVAPPAAVPNAPLPPTTSIRDINDEASEVSEIDQLLADAESWHGPLQSDLAKALASRAAAKELAVRTRRAVAAWRRSHASLATAAREHRLPETGRLVAIATQLRDLVDEIKRSDKESP